METSRIRKSAFWLMKNTLNRLATQMARRGIGPLSLIHHVGRKSGRRYQTPVLLAEEPGYLVLELTYGPRVDWYRNIEAAGGIFEVTHRGRRVRIDAIEPCDTERGRAAYGRVARAVLTATRRQEFRLLCIAGQS